MGKNPVTRCLVKNPVTHPVKHIGLDDIYPILRPNPSVDTSKPPNFKPCLKRRLASRRAGTVRRPGAGDSAESPNRVTSRREWPARVGSTVWPLVCLVFLCGISFAAAHMHLAIRLDVLH